LIALLVLDVTHQFHHSKLAFSILTTNIRLDIMNYIDLSAIINAYKLKRERIKCTANPNVAVKKSILHALQMKFEIQCYTSLQQTKTIFCTFVGQQYLIIVV
jgi:hypothetical protein